MTRLCSAIAVITVACATPTRQEITDSAPGVDVATCPVPGLDELYPGDAPPSPWADWPEAPDCLDARHDVILVLGCPSNADGTPSDCQQGRVDLALQFAAAGYGDAFIVSGNAVANEYVEAEALKSLLVAAGVPEDHVLVEPQANHTDENLYYSGQIMEAHGWQSALVVSEPGHLMYTAVCDADCCVDAGRLSTFAYPVGDTVEKAATYVLYPAATPVTAGECAHIEVATKVMCTQLSSRKACADDFQL